MWGMFALAVMTGVLFLYVPGALLLRAARVTGPACFACAPMVSLVLYMLCGVVYRPLGVFSSWFSVFVPILFFSIMLFAFGSICGRGTVIRIAPFCLVPENTTSWWTRVRSSEWAMQVLYVLLGIAVATVFFAVFLGSPEAFMQEYDNVHHLDTARSFVDSGNWSPFGAMPYGTEADVRINPLLGQGYYPTAWSSMVALVVSMLGVSVPLAANAINFTFVAIVFPARMFLLMRTIFFEKPGVIAFGSLCTLGFSAFPWMFLLFGPLYPNAAAFAVMPLLAACFVAVFAREAPIRSRVCSGTLFCVGVVCCAFTQPNAVFTAAVFLAPFCVVQAVRLADMLPDSGNRRLVQIGIGVFVCLLILAVWYALNKAPFLQSAVSHSWPATATRFQAFLDALSLGFRALGAQVLLAFLVIVGALYTLCERRYLWIACSYALSAFMYVVSASSDGPLQHLVSGFWYTDSYRMAAMAALFAIPLASLGMWAVMGVFRKSACKLVSHADYRRLSVACSGVVVVAFLLGNYYPALTTPLRDSGVSALGSTVSGLRLASDERVPTVYDAEERAFVREVKKVVPDDALVLNVPDDGSAFAYGTDELRVYYRYLRTYGEENETQESKAIRTGLNELASNEDVRSAVEHVGAEYLLLLDRKGVPGERRFLFTYEDGEKWNGVESVQDDTPGFEVVLSRDDMRLYRIVARA